MLRVVLSDGDKGLVLVGGKQKGAWYCCAQLTEEDRSAVVNDQGCGDALVAGFASAFAEASRSGENEATPREIVRRMVASATANLFTSIPGELSIQHLQRFGQHSMLTLVDLNE